jgi:hypothetical protein
MQLKDLIDTTSLPIILKQIVTKSLLLPRLLTAQKRLLPNFIIVGAQKSGTTSLYNYLIKHPYVQPAFCKEIRFFNVNFENGVDWYRANFPLKRRKGKFITGEASPGYIYHPHTPKRVFETVPQVKLIALLRNPIDRAYSNYQQNVKFGIEMESFEGAIERESEHIRGERGKMLAHADYFGTDYHRYLYLSRGIYVNYIKDWMNFFPKEQILILKSEEFIKNPSRVFHRVLKFLNLSKWKLKEYRKYNPSQYQKMKTSTRKYLIEFFKPHNQRLYEYLGRDFGWEENSVL